MKNNLYDLEMTSRKVKFTDNCIVKCVKIELNGRFETHLIKPRHMLTYL